MTHDHKGISPIVPNVYYMHTMYKSNINLQKVPLVANYEAKNPPCHLLLDLHQHGNENKGKKGHKKCHFMSNWNHLHLSLLDIGWLSIVAEESFVMRPHQARKRTQQQLEKKKNNISQTSHWDKVSDESL